MRSCCPTSTAAAALSVGPVQPESPTPAVGQTAAAQTADVFKAVGQYIDMQTNEKY